MNPRRLPLLLLALMGCDLIDQLKNPTIAFTLPKQTFNVSTNDPRWKQPPDEGVPNLTCGSGAGALVMDCCVPPAPAPPLNCQLYPMTCEAGSCVMKFNYEQASPITLADQVPQLRGQKGNIIKEILLKEIELTLNNTFNVPLPPVAIFIAPADVTSASDPGAQRLVNLPAVTMAMQSKQTILVDAQAQQAFSRFAKDFQTPFNLIASTTMVIRPGTPKPQGMLEVIVSGKVEAKF